MGQIKVRNASDQDVRGRFDGVDYIFPAGDATVAPSDAVGHIFGYGLMDKTEAFLRLGWLANKATIQDAQERLKLFSFSEAVQVFADEVDHLHISGDAPVAESLKGDSAKARRGAAQTEQPL
jgi:hypothetical protein